MKAVVLVNNKIVFKNTVSYYSYVDNKFKTTLDYVEKEIKLWLDFKIYINDVLKHQPSTNEA